MAAKHPKHPRRRKRRLNAGGANPLSGYTIITTETIDEAIELAKTCPIIGDGSIEVAEIHEVPA